ncbi:AprI/Inh family metalloprotease inhibitor [Methylobacterium radiotolerans]|uniref:AprI/Inh family metalloprotease inhibitor n=1 Tax=Methylobacterium radiotolerans TaxID=31998 RepID=UPI001F2775FF|nr:AprI/Inh family metalloprotease inhibitor [Methylobacterium radiotolerans]UIY42831.1 protease inhibitor Inh/omp19 family protein [Methylobacterium radiotolerans]
MRQAQAALLTASALIAAAAIVRPAAAQDVPAATDEAAPPSPPPAAETLAAPPAPTAPPSLPEKLGQVPGTWDLSRDGTNRRCVMTLVLDSGEAGQRLRFPAGCRRALPVLNGVAGWLFVDGALRLVDRNVRPVLEFARRPDQRSLVAQAEGGERYSLVPLDIVAMRPADAAAAPEIAPADPANPAPSPLRTAARVPAELQPAATASAGPAPGLYALDRFQQRDTCRINLDGSGGGVHIVPGCQDSGLEVFDPVRWRYTNGRMTLTAKRGHSIDLVPSGDGRWRRDPEVGTTFVLRRVD